MSEKLPDSIQNKIPAQAKAAEINISGNENTFVAHADNLEGAKELKKAIKGLCKNVEICELGPVIGSHVGSGMLAVLFLGERNLK